MSDLFNYNSLFEQAFQRIKDVRNPQALRREEMDLGWNIVSRQLIFDFGGKEFIKIQGVIDMAHEISISCLNAMIMYLFSHHKYDGVKQVKMELDKDGRSDVLFAIHEPKTKTLLIFKEIENSSFWKVKNNEPEDVRQIIEQSGSKHCKYIYLLKDYAYMQVIGHNQDEADPGRGYNLYTLKWFFETYFGIDEYKRFEQSLIDYLNRVKDYIGYIYVKVLTPNSMINFKKIIEKNIINFKYENLLKVKAKQYEMNEAAYGDIKKQFIDDKMYLTMLGSNSFSESLITSEWLYDSMGKANSIDLTIIAMGYFKAIEQLLFELICLHKNEERKIKKDFTNKELPNMVNLNTENIDAGIIDTTLGAMAVFYRDNLDMFRNDLKFQAKKYIKETIFNYAELRNEFLHKHNIHSWETINEIRNKSFYMMFLLLGSKKLSENDLQQLGLPKSSAYSDYSRLCEYVDYHSGELFFLDFEDGREIMFIACRDKFSETIGNEYVKYSGVYFKELAEHGEKYMIKEEQLPKSIYIGTLGILQSEKIKFNPKRIKKIYENGRYIGPSIAEEEGIDY